MIKLYSIFKNDGNQIFEVRILSWLKDFTKYENPE